MGTCTLVWSQTLSLQGFVADTLVIELPYDTLVCNQEQMLAVRDERNLDQQIVGIRETEKWKVIPVDQYLALQYPLNRSFKCQFRVDSVTYPGYLVIKELTLWQANQAVFSKGLMLNAYTQLLNAQAELITDWLWELRSQAAGGKPAGQVESALLTRWIKAQSEAIKKKAYHSTTYPFTYRRTLHSWCDYILLSDGFIINGHLTLYYPAGRAHRFVRGSPGIYYRYASKWESLAIGGYDQHWYFRLNNRFLARLNTTLRIGVNNFDGSHFRHVDYWNILLVNLGFTASMEYRPLFSKGLWVGLGGHLSYNILPDNVRQFAPGLLLTLGLKLP